MCLRRVALLGLVFSQMNDKRLEAIINRAIGPPKGEELRPENAWRSVQRLLAALQSSLRAAEGAIAKLEARTPLRGDVGPIGAAGADGPMGPQGDIGPAGPQGERGKDADPGVIRQIVGEEVAKAIAALPAPAPEQRKRRTVVTKHDSEGRIQEFIQEDI